MKRLLLSYGIGSLIFALLFLFVFFGATYEGFFGVIMLLAYLLMFLLALPIFLCCGIANEPPLIITVMTVLLDVTVLSFLVFIVLAVRSNRE